MMDSPSTLIYKVYVDTMFEWNSFRDTLWGDCLLKRSYAEMTFERIHDEVEYYDLTEILMQEELDEYKFEV